MSDVFVVPDGMPASVFRDKYAREKADGTYETWEERITGVVGGNIALGRAHNDRPARVYPRPPYHPNDQHERLLALAKKGVIPFSGRHVQHGDADQPSRWMDSFSNCTTAMFSWASFLLLMKGSGVGRCYDSDLCFVDWDYMPNCRFVLAGPDNRGQGGHPDYEPWIESLADAEHKYDAESDAVRWFEVDDSAEGWARIVMIIETAAFHKNNSDTIFVFDLSGVRGRGTPILGQQGRPASGPVPLIRALHQVFSIKGAGMKPWKQAIHIDHYLAACVAMGGIRRAARIACKSCYDKDVIDFIDIKRGGFLWSANNSVLVDAAFWERARDPRPSLERRVYEAAGGSSYWDDTGEPGFINVDRLNSCERDLDSINAGTYLSREFVEKFGGVHDRTIDMIDYHLRRAKAKKYKYVVNPCGEITLSVWGGYCVIGDVCLARAESLEEVHEAVGLLARALVRVNTMPSMYRAEVLRTNRIGVSLTGIHEFMWRMFDLTFREAIAAGGGNAKAAQFWDFVDQMREHAQSAADAESDLLGLPHPATYTTIKPSGTISKVMQCTEGAHLPANRYYVRWVMFPAGSDSALEFAAAGYPVKDISSQYEGYVVVGFPTCLPIVEEMPDDLLVTASEATPAEQYEWVRRLEQHWLGPDGNQVSYCLAEKSHLVTTNKGLMRIEDVRSGTALSRSGGHQEILGSLDNGVRRVVRARLVNGTEITGTRNHRVLIVNEDAEFEWCDLSDLKPGMRAVRRIGDNLWSTEDAGLNKVHPEPIGRTRGSGLHNPIKQPDFASPDLGEFIGMLMSDGHIVRNGIGLTTADPSVAERYEDLVVRLFGLPVKRRLDLANNIVVYTNSRRLVAWLLANGIPRYHDDNKIPDFILRSRRDTVCAFVRGYTLDGSHVEVCSTVSKQMAHDMAAVLWNLGYDASLWSACGQPYRFSETNKGVGKDQWHVQVFRHESRVQFAREIGYVEELKFHKVLAAYSGEPASRAHKIHAVPARRFIEFLHQHGDLWGEGGVSRRGVLKQLRRSTDPKRLVSVDVIDREFVGKMSGIDVLCDEALRFTAVAEVIELDEPVHTYDISVSESHEYVVNGVVVHNTNKWRKDETSYEDYMRLLLDEQPTVRCCALMPQVEQDASAYAYLPEEPVTRMEYDALVARISAVRMEGYDSGALLCEGGVCPTEEDIHASSVGVTLSTAAPS